MNNCLVCKSTKELRAYIFGPRLIDMKFVEGELKEYCLCEDCIKSITISKIMELLNGKL